MPMFSRTSSLLPLLPPVAVAVLAVAGCKGTEEAKTAGPADIGGTIIIATAADAGTLLPPLIRQRRDQRRKQCPRVGCGREVTDMLYDRLAELPQNLNAVG